MLRSVSGRAAGSGDGALSLAPLAEADGFFGAEAAAWTIRPEGPVVVAYFRASGAVARFRVVPCHLHRTRMPMQLRASASDGFVGAGGGRPDRGFNGVRVPEAAPDG